MTDSTTTSVPAIERTLDLGAAPERVWRAISDSDELARWFGQRADLRPEVGYEGWMEWDGHGRYAMHIVEAEPFRRLAVRWMTEPDQPLDPERSTLVEWDLEPIADGGTRLHLRESGFRSDARRRANSAGWVSELGELVELLADEPWQAGIRRVYHLRSDIDRVWRAFSDPVEFGQWWGGSHSIELRPGTLGWWDWPSEGGRFAVRIDEVDPPTYLAWTWSIEPNVPLDEARTRLRTQWALEARDDGGTDLYLLETGFTEPDGHRQNSGGWDGDVIPALRRVLDEPEPNMEPRIGPTP
jgi:uncharacterized protein YndB with AHSA1/START domain